MPAVSIIIPAYCHAHLIGETLESVFRQSFTDYEVIVVNDGSPDETADVVRPYLERGQVAYFEQPNAGQAAARNRGLRAACGEFVALLDDDDCWPPNKLEWQVASLRRDPDLCLVAGDVRSDWPSILRDQGEELGPPVSAPTFENLLLGNPIISPGQTLIRGAALSRIGGFREDIWGSDDWDLYLRLSKLGRLEIYGRAALYYRQHSANASRDMSRLLRNALSVLQTHLADLDPAARRRGMARTREWLYAFGLEGVVFEIKQCYRRGEPSALVEGLGELVRRLQIIRLDPIVLKCLLRDLLGTRFA